MATLLGDHYHVDIIPFALGDRLLLYTDGISESRDLTGTFYPLAQRVRRWASATPRQLLDDLHRDLLAYVPGTRDDDLAALIAHRRQVEPLPDRAAAPPGVFPTPRLAGPETAPTDRLDAGACTVKGVSPEPGS